MWKLKSAVVAAVVGLLIAGGGDAVSGSGHLRPSASLRSAPAVPGLDRFTYRQMHMGVQVRVVLYAPDSSSARTAARRAFDRISELTGLLSSYRTSSELSRLNRRAGGSPMRVSPELFYVLHRAAAIAAETDGAFDPTVGPLSELWDRARSAGRVPTSAELERTDSLVGWSRLELDPAARTARLARAGMQLDLGAIAKGYVLDEALEALERSGVERALVDAGGDVAAGRPPPGRSGWSIRVPLAPPDTSLERIGGELSGRTLSLAHAAVATSGDTQQYVEIGGNRYSHVVDPRSGLGLTHRLAATVVAPTGLVADAYATAVSVLGPEDGRRFLADRPGVRGLIYRLDEAPAFERSGASGSSR